MLASRHGSHTLVTVLLSLVPPASLVSAADNDGNTALHYASAYGHLKCIRTLLQAGASPVARNTFSWTPIGYSSTVAAEVYFRSLVAEMERRWEGEREMGRRREGGVRVVPDDEGEDGGRVVTPMKGIGLGLGLGLSSGQAWGNLGRRRAGSAE